ncbi:MAG: hypothetical protein BZ136_08540, partial [Methanosphaera sp. rholeuAM74]
MCFYINISVYEKRGDNIISRKLFVFLSVMVILCSLTAINASDVDDAVDDSSVSVSNNNQEAVAMASADDVANNDEKINKKVNSKTLKTDSGKGTFKQLQELIDNADEDSIIYLDKDYSNEIGFLVSASAVSINKPITIDGRGHTLDAIQQNRVF